MVIKLKGKLCKEYNLQQLKEMLKKEKLKVSGTKEELCIRLRDHYKQKRKQGKSVASVKAPKKLKDPDPSNALFRFYASAYYQVKGGTMAKTELAKYGLDSKYLDGFRSYQELYKNLLKDK